jgi:hypothetical protein
VSQPASADRKPVTSLACGRPQGVIAGKNARQLARELLAMTPEAFSLAFGKSPMKRAKPRGLKHNAAVVLGSVGTADDVISQDVGPWNVRFATSLPADSPYQPHEAIAGRVARTLAREILSMTQAEFSRALRGSPMKRAGLHGLERNAAVARPARETRATPTSYARDTGPIQGGLVSRRRALLVLDACMAVLFIVLLSWHLTGLALHEWLGLTLIATTLGHLLVHWGWMEARAAQAVRGTHAGRWAFALNAGLFAAMGATLISGVVISKVAAPNRLSPASYLRWHGVHDTGTLLAVVLLGAHLALNWDRVRSALDVRTRSRRLGWTWRSLARRAGSIAAAVAVLAAGLWTLVHAAPGSGQVLMTFPDGHRALVAPPAEITLAGPDVFVAAPRTALPRIAVSIALLAVVALATRFSIVRRRGRIGGATYASSRAPSRPAP